MTIIKVNNLVKRYVDLIALDHFSVEIEEGEIFGLLGPNGSGKTTAINCILSLLTYDKGETIELFDVNNDILADIKSMPHIVSAEFKDNILLVKSTRGKNNLAVILDYLKSKNIAFGKIYSEPPTLNDVFLEITGKDLRD